MTIHSIIVSLIKLAVFALFGFMAGACVQAPVKPTAAIPKIDITALPFAVQPVVTVNPTENPTDAAMPAGAANSESPEQSSPTAAAPTVPEEVATETSTSDIADRRSLPPSLTSLPKMAVTEQTPAPPENIIEPSSETAAETAAAVSTSAAEEQAQLTPAPDAVTESTQAPETLTVIEGTATGSVTANTPTSSAEASPDLVSNPPPDRQNVSGENSRNTAAFADSAYDGCKIIHIYGNYISVSITRNGTDALLVSLDLPNGYNSLQTMINYIAYADFEPASYYPYKAETPAKIAEIIRNGKVECVLQES